MAVTVRRLDGQLTVETTGLVIASTGQEADYSKVSSPLWQNLIKRQLAIPQTNSTEAVAHDQLKHAWLASYFDDVFSADTVKRLKPAAEPYRMVSTRLGVAATDVCLVAAHTWDIAGAAHLGYRTAFIARPGKVLDPLIKEPNIVGRDLTAGVDQLLASSSSGSGT